VCPKHDWLTLTPEITGTYPSNTTLWDIIIVDGTARILQAGGRVEMGNFKILCGSRCGCS
jgi:hypothetical protein